jgi:YbaB/EbfC DNA-binding family
MSFGVMDGQRWVDGYRSRSAELGDRAAESARELDGITASATSRDGAATVTVDAAGALQRLVFGPAAEPLTRSDLADAVLEAARRARARAARDAVAAVVPLVGSRSAALRMLRAQLPDAAGTGEP